MDVLVVDSSVAVKWFVVEAYSTEAQRILDTYQNGTLSLLAPDLINAEFGNIIWKKHIFQGLAASDADDIFDKFRQMQFTFTPTAGLLEDAYKIAATYRRSVYDALYLALSVRENCRFVTADEKLVNAVGSHFRFLAASFGSKLAGYLSGFFVADNSGTLVMLYGGIAVGLLIATGVLALLIPTIRRMMGGVR